MQSVRGFLLMELGLCCALLATLFCTLSVWYGYALGAHRQRIDDVYLIQEVRSYIDRCRAGFCHPKDGYASDEVTIEIAEYSSGVSACPFFLFKGRYKGRSFDCISGIYV